MDAVELWAAVALTAQGGDTEGLLGAAAREGLHLRRVEPLPGGFSARCAAGRYLQLASLARRRRVRLRVTRRRGLRFLLRPLFRRAGLWAGLACFLPLILWARGLVWAVEYPGLTPGQQARAEAALRSVELMPGARVTQSLLSDGEFALLESGEFAWASVNFFGGRLTVEAAPARAAPEIFSGSLQALRAKADGVVTEVTLKSGTPLVAPGQQVAAGQDLIGTARSERDGTLIFEPAAGSVIARFEWDASCDQPLEAAAPLLTGETETLYSLFFSGKRVSLPVSPDQAPADAAVTRHIQPDLLGLPLPFSIEETTLYRRQAGTVYYPDDLALSMARLHCLEALCAEYPDARIVARRENVEMDSGLLRYSVTYTLLADIAG